MLKIKNLIFVLSISLITKACFAIHFPNMAGCHIPISDYGILTNQEKIPHKNVRWQCFPVDEVSINLMDWVMKKDFSDQSTVRSGNLTITGFSNGKNLREECQGRSEYSFLEIMSVEEAEKILHQLQRVIKNRKYVCILGRHVSKELIFNGEQPLDNWYFEKIRTKKRCYSYS